MDSNIGMDKFKQRLTDKFINSTYDKMQAMQKQDDERIEGPKMFRFAKQAPQDIVRTRAKSLMNKMEFYKTIGAKFSHKRRQSNAQIVRDSLLLQK